MGPTSWPGTGEDEDVFSCHETEPPWDVVWELPVPLNTAGYPGIRVLDGHLHYRSQGGTFLVASADEEPWQLPKAYLGNVALCNDGSALVVEPLDLHEGQVVRAFRDGTFQLIVEPYSVWHTPVWSVDEAPWPMSQGMLGPELMLLSGCRDFLYVRSTGIHFQLVRVDVEAGNQRIIADPLIRSQGRRTSGDRAVLFLTGDGGWGCSGSSWLVSEQVPTPISLGINPPNSWIYAVVIEGALFFESHSPPIADDTPCGKPQSRLGYGSLEPSAEWQHLGEPAGYSRVDTSGTPEILLRLEGDEQRWSKHDDLIADHGRGAWTRWWVRPDGSPKPEPEPIADDALYKLEPCGRCDLLTATSDGGATFDVIKSCYESPEQ